MSMKECYHVTMNICGINPILVWNLAPVGIRISAMGAQLVSVKQRTFHLSQPLEADEDGET